MTNGPEKSDSAIRATKPANKAGRPAAEWVEQRAEAKGNTGQQRTGRAQNREGVSQGLERVRQAARQRKKERFTALLHHVTVDLLREAFYALKRKAAPGVDGLRWQDYEAGLEDNLRSFFDSVSQDWLVRFLEHRIGDQRIIRLVRKWLKAGVLEDGEWSVSDEGTPQGAVASPLLANVYLHYVFDLWAARWRRREARGNVIIVRYADDIVVGFEHEADARRFWEVMRSRFEQFSLALHPDKTRLLEFGRHAAANRMRRGLGRPETLPCRGFIFICGKSRRGAFQLQRKTRRDRMRAKLREIKEQLQRRMHEPIPEQGRWLKQVVSGFFAYHAVPTNSRALSAFRHYVTDRWRRTLRRRSQKDGMTWERIAKIADAWLPQPRILHPWPEQRFAVRHPRWEPSA